MSVVSEPSVIVISGPALTTGGLLSVTFIVSASEQCAPPVYLITDPNMSADEYHTKQLAILGSTTDTTESFGH